MGMDMNCRPAEQRIEMGSHGVGDLTIHTEGKAGEREHQHYHDSILTDAKYK